MAHDNSGTKMNASGQWSCLVVAILLCATVAIPAPELSSDPIIKEWSGNLVRIHAGDRVGYGVVVGWSWGEAWIATPGHVMYGDELHPEPPPRPSSFPDTVSVHFAGAKRGVGLCAERVVRHPKADLTFICAKWEGDPWFFPSIVPRRYVPGEQIVIVGGPDGNVRSTSSPGILRSGPLGSFNERGGDLEAENLNGNAGQSGALVASRRGVVGMYLGSGSEILSLRAIEEHVRAEQPQIIWRLTARRYFDPEHKRTVCANVSETITPSAIELTDSDTQTSHVLEPRKCADLPEGFYAIKAAETDLFCQPTIFELMTDTPSDALQLACTLRLTGDWKLSRESAIDETLTCTDGGPNRVTCAGLSALGLGYFNGQLTWSGRDILVTGQFIANTQRKTAEGRLRWSPGRLTGHIRREKFPPKQITLILELK